MQQHCFRELELRSLLELLRMLVIDKNTFPIGYWKDARFALRSKSAEHIWAVLLLKKRENVGVVRWYHQFNIYWTVTGGVLRVVDIVTQEDSVGSIPCCLNLVKVPTLRKREPTHVKSQRERNEKGEVLLTGGIRFHQLFLRLCLIFKS